MKIEFEFAEGKHITDYPEIRAAVNMLIRVANDTGFHIIGVPDDLTFIDEKDEYTSHLLSRSKPSRVYEDVMTWRQDWFRAFKNDVEEAINKIWDSHYGKR